MIASCSNPEAGEYVVTVCIAGDTTTVGNDTGIASCDTLLPSELEAQGCPKNISTGVIIVVALVGAVVLALLVFWAWFSCKRLKSRVNQRLLPSVQFDSTMTSHEISDVTQI